MSSSSKDSNLRGTSALALIKVALGLDVDARTRTTTYVAHWSSVGASSKLLLCASLILLLRSILWTLRKMAADGMPSNLLRLVKAYFVSTKMKVRASESYSMLFEIRSGVRQGCALFPTRFIIDWILGQALQDYPGVQV